MSSTSHLCTAEEHMRGGEGDKPGGQRSRGKLEMFHSLCGAHHALSGHYPEV